MDKHDEVAVASAVTPVDIAQADLVADTDVPVRMISNEGTATTVTKSADGEELRTLRTLVEEKCGDAEPDESPSEKDQPPCDEKSSIPSVKTVSEDKPHQHNRLKDIQDIDALQAQGKKRNKWYQLWRPKNGPPPPPASLDDVPEIPLATASLLSQLTYTWVTPLMTLGYQRPLMATDLWKMDKTREAGPLADKFMQSYSKREIAAKEYNAKLIDPVEAIQPSRYQRLKWRTELIMHPRRHRLSALPAIKAGPSQSTRAQKLQILEEAWRQGSGRRKASIVMSLNDTLTGFWAGGIFKVVGDTAQLMAPLLTKALITFSREGKSSYAVRTDTSADLLACAFSFLVYDAHAEGVKGPNIGRGVGYAIGLFFLTILASVCQHQVGCSRRLGPSFQGKSSGTHP
jgi:hypothetical protein